MAIHLSRSQLERLDEVSFYGKLQRFVTARCLNPKLQAWLAAQAPEHAVWHAAWPRLRQLSEHDCALVLIFLAVCACEAQPTGPLEALIAHLPEHEVGIKSFLAARGYFHFSAFEFAPPDRTGKVG